MRALIVVILALAPWLVAANGFDDDYDELPASLRDCLDSEAQLRKQPPADLAEIRSLQE